MIKRFYPGVTSDLHFEMIPPDMFRKKIEGQFDFGKNTIFQSWEEIIQLWLGYKTEMEGNILN